MFRDLLRRAVLWSAAITLLELFAGPARAQNQLPSVNFDFFLTYYTHLENALPSPLLTVQPGSCSYQSSSTSIYYNLIHDQINYSSSARVTATYAYRNDGGVYINCHFVLNAPGQELSISDFIYYPASGVILAVLAVYNTSYFPETEIANLSYVDTSNPDHKIYHFQGNDALFALAQQTFGVNFSGVELLFDVQAPSS